ncbi:MAG: beta-galactosidase [Acidobacteria bacterium]|nr:beta-galactosidase [Acidobacteriota bacterium]
MKNRKDSLMNCLTRFALSLLLMFALILMTPILPTSIGETASRQAQTGDAAITPPKGLYCSCPPTSTRSHSVLPEVAAKDFVDGILIRIGWSDLEPVEGSPTWTLLDNELELARQAGKKVTLAVVNGPAAPAWLTTKGAKMFSYTFRGGATALPVPWDEIYLSAWTSFVARLGARYQNNANITLVHITHSTSNGFEMQLPFSPIDQQAWQQIGYTEQRLIDSWKTVVDAFASAFPASPLDVEVHPVLGSDLVAQGVVTYGQAQWGTRFGVFAGWWSQKNAASVYPGMFRLIQAAATQSFSAIQMVASHTQTPDDFGDGGIFKAAELALDTGVQYQEVWNSDILNSALEPLMREINNAAPVPSVPPALVAVQILKKGKPVDYLVAGAKAKRYQITLTGSGFNANSKVLLNSTEVQASLVSASQMSAKLLPGRVPAPGMMTVEVRNGGLSSSTLTIEIRNE